jgi:lipopolysaccharide biosynthesis glycosyltransferase
MVHMNKKAVVVPTSLAWLKFAVISLDSYVRTTPSILGVDLCLLVPRGMLANARDIVNQANLDFDIRIDGFDSAKLEGYPITSRWGEVSWYRTTLPDLPEYEQCDQILLIGVDVYCSKMDDDIFSFPLAHSIGAVREPRNSPTYQYPPFNEVASRYFNADVLLYNCPKWRHNGDGEKIRETIVSSDVRYPFADQDVLNRYFSEQWDELPATLNWIPAFHNSRTYRHLSIPSVIQWAGKWKPWDSALVPPIGMTREWRERYQIIWNGVIDHDLAPLTQEMTARKPLRALLSFYVPILLPLVNFLPRVRDKLRLILRSS